MGDFKGVTFSAQNVTPKDDGALYNAHYGDGILDGCEMAISGDDLVIQPGHFIACGRVCHVDGATSVDLSGRQLQTGYIEVIMNYDLSQGEGQQWYTTFVESATTSFPALTQEDINGVSGTLYQFQLAIVQVSGGNLTDVYFGQVASNIVGNRNINLFGSETQLLFYQADGSFRGVVDARDTNITLAKRDSNSGDQVAGIRLYEGQPNDAIIYGSGGNLVLRPHGVANSTGQWYLDGSGQMHGGSLSYATSVTSKSCPASTNTQILEISNLSIAGRYLIFVTLSISMSSTNTNSFYINIYKNNSKLAWDMKSYITRNGPSFLAGAVFCTSPSSVQVKIEPAVAMSVTGTLELINIG